MTLKYFVQVQSFSRLSVTLWRLNVPAINRLFIASKVSDSNTMTLLFPFFVLRKPKRVHYSDLTKIRKQIGQILLVDMHVHG